MAAMMNDPGVREFVFVIGGWLLATAIAVLLLLLVVKPLFGY